MYTITGIKIPDIYSGLLGKSYLISCYCDMSKVYLVIRGITQQTKMSSHTFKIETKETLFHE